jgi:hypothetical protein
MGQTRLSSLSLLCIESGLLQYLDTNSIIDKFSMKKKQEEVILKSTVCCTHVLSKLIMLQVNCICFIISYIRCRWYKSNLIKSNDVLHCVEIRISYIIILWYYVVFVDIWSFQKNYCKIYIYILDTETLFFANISINLGAHWWVWPRAHK